MIITGIFIVGCTLISNYVINWNSYEQAISKQLEKSFGEGAISISHLDGSLLMPKLNAYNVYFNSSHIDNISHDTLVIPKLEIKISILSLLLFSPKIKSLHIESIDLKLNHILNFISLFKNTEQSIRNISIENGNIQLDSTLFKNIQFQMLNVILDNRMLINTNIIAENQTYALSINFDGSEQKVSLDSDLLAAQFHGKNSEGKLEINGHNLANTIDRFIKPLSFNTKLWNQFTVNADIAWSEDNLSVHNFKLLEDNLIMNLEFDRLYSKNYTNLNISINEINLDALLDKEAQGHFSFFDIQEYLEGNKDANSSGRILIEAENIVYKEDIIDKIIFDSEIHGKILKINQFMINMPGDSNLDIAGNITNNDIVSRFDGHASLQSQDTQTFLNWLSPLHKQTEKGILNLTSEISITPNAFSLNNTNLQIDDMVAELTLFIKKDTRQEQMKSTVILNNLNLDHYKFKQIIQDQASHWMSYELDIDLNAHNINYHETVFDDISLTLLSDRGEVLIKDITCNSKDLQAKANVTLVKKDIETLVDANASIDHINTKIFNFDKILDIQPDPDHPKVTWSTSAFSTSWLDKLNGKLSIEIQKTKAKFFALDNTRIDLALHNNVLSINRFTSGINNEGKIDLTANIGMDSESSILLSFALNNLDLTTITKNIFNINALSEGQASCVCSVKSKGKNMQEFIRNLDGKMEIASRNIKIKNFDIDQLFTKIQNVQNKSELATLIKVLIYSNSTNVEYLDGLINIKNGITASTLKLKTDNSTGVFSSHLSLQDFHINSTTRFFFITNYETKPEVLSLDIALTGPIWLPKIYLDTNKIYNMITEHQNNVATSD